MEIGRLMVYLCGDLHGYMDINKLSSKMWPEGHALSKNDILIVLGDFGLFCRGRGDEWWLKWLDNKPWTTWFIPGNHENYDILDKFPIEERGEFLRIGVTPKVIENKIYIIRGEKVMLDSDLAELYQIETKNLIKAVKRNLNHFPDDFMFQ